MEWRAILQNVCGFCRHLHLSHHSRVGDIALELLLPVGLDVTRDLVSEMCFLLDRMAKLKADCVLVCGRRLDGGRKGGQERQSCFVFLL